MSEKFNYTTGLNNAGPFLAAGRPYVTGSDGLVIGDEDRVEFPKVTKEVQIRVPAAPNNAYKFEENDGFFFAINQAGSGPFDLGGTSKPYTISLWVSASQPTTTNDAIITLFAGGAKKSTFKVRGAGVRFEDNAGSMANIDTGGPSIVGAGWKNFIITQSGSTSTHVYENGVHKASDNSILGQIFDDVYIPANSTAAMHGGYDQLTIWNSLFTVEDVAELYNDGDYFDPTVHSKVSNLQAWYTFGDNPLDSVGASAVIQDQSPNDRDTNMNGFGGSDALSVVAGPFTSTSGQLRVHLLSTGSSAGSTRVFNNKHYWELSGYDSKVTLPLKTKEIYLSSNDRTMQYELYASLTSISTGSMYALTGSGVDE